MSENLRKYQHCLWTLDAVVQRVPADAWSNATCNRWPGFNVSGVSVRTVAQCGSWNFGAIAQALSEDAASAAENGDLGWVVPGDFVPEFD